MSKNLPSIQVINRATKLLDAITEHEPPVTLKILSVATGLHPATAFRILGSLTGNGFVSRDAKGRYQLGVKFLQLASRTRMQISLENEAAPVMESLRDSAGATVYLSVREGLELVYIKQLTKHEMAFAPPSMIGLRAPLHVTAVGKLMLGDLGESFCRQYADQVGLATMTQHSITDIDKLWQEAAQAVERGVGIDNEETEPGLFCFGALIRDHTNHVIAGLSICARPDQQDQNWMTLLKDAAHTLSSRLGYIKLNP